MFYFSLYWYCMLFIFLIDTFAKLINLYTNDIKNIPQATLCMIFK